MQDLRIQFSEFIKELHDNGFRILPEHYVDLNTIIGRLDLSSIPFNELADYLCPIFAISKEQQWQFHTIFKEYFKNYLKKTPENLANNDPSPSSDIQSIEPFFKVRKRNPLISKAFRQRYAVQLFILLGIILMLYLISQFSFPTVFNQYGNFLGTLAILGLSILIVSVIVAITYYLSRIIKRFRLTWALVFCGLFVVLKMSLNSGFNYWFTLGELLGAFLIMVFISIFFRSYWDNKNKNPKRSPPYFFRPIVPTEKVQILDDKESHEASLPIVNSLAEAEFIDEIDLPKTLNQTVRNAGRLKIEFKNRALNNNYLMLIDVVGANNHQQAWYNYIYSKLKEQDVKVERYYFNTDPTTCWNQPGEYLPLSDLFNLQRLLVFTSGDAFVDPFLGRTYPWVENAFEPWIKIKYGRSINLKSSSRMELHRECN